MFKTIKLHINLYIKSFENSRIKMEPYNAFLKKDQKQNDIISVEAIYSKRTTPRQDKFVTLRGKLLILDLI